MDRLEISDSDIDNYFTTDDVISTFKSLKPSTFYGSELPYRFLKLFISSLAFPIKCMFDRFLKLRSLPFSFNSAIITPLYKRKGKRSDPSSYRPISILPLLSKLFEKMIFRKLYSYVEKENLLDDRQHGFRRHRSCTTLLSIFLNDITTNLDAANMMVG